MQMNAPPQQSAYTVSKLFDEYKRITKVGFPDPVLLTGEISEVIERGEYTTITLREGTGALVRIDTKIKTSSLAYASRDFTRLTGQAVEQGKKVTVLGKPVFTSFGGGRAEFWITYFDPTAALGEGEKERRRIIEYLKAHGLDDKTRNNQGRVPSNFHHVAVIAGQGRQGHADFASQASLIEECGLVRFSHFEATMQGRDMERSICNAFQEAAKLHRIDPLDVIVIIRGGGDFTGISELNNMNVALAVVNSPVPVFTGIGHENDKIILDDIACKCFSTPSAVIAFIFDALKTNYLIATKAVQSVKQIVAGQVLTSLDAQSEQAKGAVSSAAERFLGRYENVIQNRLRSINANAQYTITEHDAKLNLAKRAVQTSTNTVLENVESGLRGFKSDLSMRLDAQLNCREEEMIQCRRRVHKVLDSNLIQSKSKVVDVTNAIRTRVELVLASQEKRSALPVSSICHSAKGLADQALQHSLGESGANTDLIRQLMMIALPAILLGAVMFFLMGVVLGIVAATVAAAYAFLRTLKRQKSAKHIAENLRSKHRVITKRIQALNLAIHES